MGLSCEWMEGYVFDIPYTSNFFFYQTPDFLNFCLLLNGFEHPPLKNFKFLELGSGMGFNLNCMAALYPNGEFYGIDFNPEHIYFSNKIKEGAGLKNVSFYELSFEEFLKERKEEFPKFDYIISHGVFSFVSDENKNFIVEIIKNKLKEGGVCYISYNDMCGWFLNVSVQRLLLDYSRLFPDLGSIAKINMAINFLEKMKEAGCKHFNLLPIMKKLFNKFEKDRVNYLAHEYLNETWKPLFFTDVLSYMKGAKVKYVCQADPIWYFEDLFLTNKQLEFLKGLRSPLLKEIVKDYMVGMGFRKDLYTKGGQTLAKGELIDRIKNVKVVLRRPVKQEKFRIGPPYNKNVHINSQLIKKLMEVLRDNSYTIGEILTLSGFESMEVSNILWIISILLHLRVIDVVLEDEHHNMEGCVILNKVVAKEARYKNLLQQFCIPKSKSGIFVDIIERLVYDAIANEGLKDLDSIISYVIKYSNEHEGVNFTKGEIEDEISHCIEEDMVQWERLGIIDIKL